MLRRARDGQAAEHDRIRIVGRCIAGGTRVYDFAAYQWGFGLMLVWGVISLLLLALTLAYLERRAPAATASWRSFWPLYLLFAVWVNVDTWFLLGPLVTSCAVGPKYVPLQPQMPQSWHEVSATAGRFDRSILAPRL